MFLKIKGYGDNDWWIFGDLKKIHYEFVEYHEHIKLDLYESLICDESREHPTEEIALSIYLRHSDNEQWNILTDSVGYICNEHGETIEKIVC